MRTHVVGLLIWVLLLLSGTAYAQRSTPALTSPGPITQGTVEQGPVGVTQIVSLVGPNYGNQPKPYHDVLLYNEHTGHAWLVVNWGFIYSQHSFPHSSPTAQFECVVYTPLAAGLKLTTSKIDEDAFDDIIGLRSDGKIFRYYRRGLPGC